MKGTAFSVMRRIEAEYGEPYWDVVRGYAEQGCSRQEVAELFECDYTGFRRLLRRHPEQVIPWPGKGRSIRSLEFTRRISPLGAAAHQAARRKRLAFGVTDSVSGHARRHGHKPRTVYERLRLGWSLERALREPVVSPRESGMRGMRARWGRAAA